MLEETSNRILNNKMRNNTIVSRFSKSIIIRTYYLIFLSVSPSIISRLQIIQAPKLKGCGNPVVWSLRYAGSWKRLVASAIARINRFPREYIKQKTVGDQRVTVHLVYETRLWNCKLAKRNAWRFYDPWCLLWYLPSVNGNSLYAYTYIQMHIGGKAISFQASHNITIEVGV